MAGGEKKMNMQKALMQISKHIFVYYTWLYFLKLYSNFHLSSFELKIIFYTSDYNIYMIT
jgi:hypothetical protein